ncbi:MAG: hypothetical protein DMF93_24420 [Acidobacteria bacterium]|nr:MAG: hypothetical protein DMF93_24420 [Acidobacteriota bacterium]
MRWLAIIAASLAAVTTIGSSTAAQRATPGAPRPAIEKPRVRVYQTTAGSLVQLDHAPGVIVSLDDSDLGRAVWADDAAAPSGSSPPSRRVVVVQPRRAGEAQPPPAAGSRPGDAPFTGMSFKPIFENDRVSVIRARMEVGAQEGVHTHGADTIVVHLSGGEIEDTADGRTVVNRWTRGDVEFEGRGTSHSARNVGGAIDVVLVALRP